MSLTFNFLNKLNDISDLSVIGYFQFPNRLLKLFVVSVIALCHFYSSILI